MTQDEYNRAMNELNREYERRIDNLPWSGEGAEAVDRWLEWRVDALDRRLMEEAT